MAQLTLPASGIRLSDVFQLAKAYVFGTGYSSTSGIVAHAGGGQTSAVPLKSYINQISTCVSAGDSVMLPKAVTGSNLIVVNAGAQNLGVYPDLGDAANGGSVNASVTVNAGSTAIFFCALAGDWRVNF